MKLNSWGYMQMFILSSVIIFFLLVVVYNVNVFRSHFNNDDISVSYYRDLEERLENQTLTYIDKYYEDVLTSEQIVITNDMLGVYDLDVSLFDKNSNNCNGYALASKTRGLVSVDAYISCKKYETLGYQDWRV